MVVGASDALLGDAETAWHSFWRSSGELSGPLLRAPPSAHCNWRILPSGHRTSLPTLSLPLPPTPLTLFAAIWEGAAQAGVGAPGVRGCGGGGGGPRQAALGARPTSGAARLCCLETPYFHAFFHRGLLQRDASVRALKVFWSERQLGLMTCSKSLYMSGLRLVFNNQTPKTDGNCHR